MKEKVAINEVDCGQLCKALVAGGDLDGAFEVVVLMRDRWKIRLNAQLCVLLLSGCTRLGNLERGKEIHFEIVKNGIAVNHFLGSMLISMYSKLQVGL